MKLSRRQIEAISLMQKYPKCIVMQDGWMTGGHGVRILPRTIKALEAKGLVYRGNLTKEGFSIVVLNKVV